MLFLRNVMMFLAGGLFTAALVMVLIDAWRILPNFYEDYARRRGLRLVGEFFEYLGFGAVASFRNPDSSYKFPPPSQSRSRVPTSRSSR